MTFENLDADKQKNKPEPRPTVVPTVVAFRTGGALSIDDDGCMAFIRDTGEKVPFIPRTHVENYAIMLNLEPSGDKLHLHARMSGVLHVDSAGKLTSVLGESVLPFLPSETVASFLGTVELADGRCFTFNHEGCLFGLPTSEDVSLDVCGPPVPAGTAEQGERQIDFAELQRHVSLEQVLEIIGWSYLCRSGANAQGPCPLHESRGEDDWKFFVDLDANTFECRSPGCEQKGNQLDLYAAVTRQSVDQAAVELCEKMRIEVPRCV